MSAITDAELLAQLRHMYEALTTIPADDLATIEHLDFAPPCDRYPGTDPRWPACDNTADYFVTTTRHCPERPRVTPWCSRHLNAQMTKRYPLMMVCPACGERVLTLSPGDFILAFEPIGGKS